MNIDVDIEQAGLREMHKDLKLMEMWSKVKDTNDNGELRDEIYRHILRYHYYTPDTIYDLDNRIEQLENKVFKKNKRNDSSRAQQMLLLYHLGFLDTSVIKGISSNTKRAKLLSLILNADADNIEGDLTNLIKNSSYLKIERNYELLLQAFKDAGLEDQAKEAETELNRIKEEQKNK